MFFTKRKPVTSTSNRGPFVSSTKDIITCKSCKHYLFYTEDKRLVRKNKTVRGSIIEKHLCAITHPRRFTPYVFDKYGILKSLTPCELYRKKPVGEDEEGRGMMYPE